MIRLIFPLFFFIVSIAGFSIPLQDRSPDLTAVRQLASELGIDENEDLIAAMQTQWIRKAGQELWQIAELSPEKKRLVLDWSIEHGLYAEWHPALAEYGDALIFGATTGHMRLRLNHLVKLWKEGIRCKQVVWLTGDRPLDPSLEEFTDRCRTESDAAHIIWEKADLPGNLRNLPVQFIAAPMHTDGKRPNTLDTLHAYLTELPLPETALFISSQPFCGYQHEVIRSVLPEACSFDVAGPSRHPSAAAITLDSIARWVYQSTL